MSTALLIVVAAALLLLCRARLGLLNPASITAVLWLAIGVLMALRPFQILEPTLQVSAVISAGLAALCLPPVLLAGRRTGVPLQTGPPAAGRLTVRPWALAVAAVVVLLLSLYGVLQYRSAVSAALGGTPFSQLDPQLVRWAELYGNLKLSTTAAVALSAAPLLGCIAVVGGLAHRWWWYLLVPVALLLVSQSPSRTATLGVVVGSVFFFLFLSRAQGGALQTRGPLISGRKLGAVVVVAAGLGLTYFTYIGQALSKSTAAPGLFPARWVPTGLVEPLLFQVGGVSAFTQALAHPVDPGGPYGHFGRSMYLVVRIAQALGIHLPGPAPYADYVDIPTAFNTYTAFGDVYFDLGLAGVIGLFLVMGLLVHLFSRWPERGHPVSAWLLGTMVVALGDSAIDVRFLDVDVVLQAVGGALLLALVLRRKAPSALGDPAAGEETGGAGDGDAERTRAAAARTGPAALAGS